METFCESSFTNGIIWDSTSTETTSLHENQNFQLGQRTKCERDFQLRNEEPLRIVWKPLIPKL